MKNLLVINSSIFTESSSASRSLGADLVRRLIDAHGPMTITHRDLGADPLPHLDADTFAAFASAPEDRSPSQQTAVDLSDRLIDELERADMIVIGAPMYNFGVPSALKAWFDHIARAGRTFRYTSDGPQGLLADRPVYVVATRGGRYRGTAADHVTNYLRQFLAFIGIEDLRFVYAEGLGQSQQRDRILEEARREIADLAA